MKDLTVALRGTSPISFSKYVADVKENETHEEFEERIWKEKAHYDSDGNVIIPGIFLMHSIANTAQLLAIPIKGNALFTKHFQSVRVIGSINTQVHKNDLEYEWVYGSSDGSSGGKKRVPKCYPIIKDSWEGSFRVIVPDPVLCDNMHVFERVIHASGVLMGFGRWRAGNRGLYGTYEVIGISENGNGDQPKRRRGVLAK